jgi:hypothetical protein
MVIDETVTESGFAAVCVAVVDSPAKAQRQLDEARDALLVDPYFRDIPSVRGSLANVGFHFSQDSLDVRRKAIETLQALSFEAYIAFNPRLTVDPDYDWYDSLLSGVLPDRLSENRHRKCRLIAEIHGLPSVRLQRLQTLVSDMAAHIERRAGRPFLDPPSVELGAKQQSYLAIADYSVGCFREFWLVGQHDKASIAWRHFREVWARIRLVLDTSTGTRYWRRHPLPGFK